MKRIFQLKNFSNAGHGKSTMDGIGGIIKNMCHTYVANSNNISSANDMLDLIKKKNCPIEAFVVIEQRMNEVEKYLEFEISTVDKTMLVHQVIWSKNMEKKIKTCYLSCSEWLTNATCHHYQLSTVNFEK